jgi:hypothetical protein
VDTFVLELPNWNADIRPPSLMIRKRPFLRYRELREVRTGSGCIDPYFPDLSALAGGQWSALRHDRSIPGERDAGTHRIGSSLDPRASLDDVEKILDAAGTRTPIPRSSSP